MNLFGNHENLLSFSKIMRKIFSITICTLILALFRLFFYCFGSTETPKHSVLILNRNKRLVSNRIETSFVKHPTTHRPAAHNKLGGVKMREVGEL
jgi:hypothetical protein